MPKRRHGEFFTICRRPNHTPEFWARLERAVPDSGARKRWLAENGGRYL